MSWRTVIINKRCKLDLSMNYMVVRAEETARVLIDEIAIVIIENNAVSMTGCLLTALVEKKVKVIFCDNSRNPQFELSAYYGCHNDSLKIKAQIIWSEQIKKDVWTRIVYEKISNQSLHLQKRNKLDESKLIASYLDEILPGDESNREGHAAKVYFNALFGMEFTRKDEDNLINAALNYGYALILSAVNREIALNGYLTQLGLFHDNQFNHFNLGCDIMEPLRIVVDEKVQNNSYNKFETEEKHDIVSVLNRTVIINDTQQVMLNAIKIYVKSVFDALNEENVYLIKFPRLL